MRNDSYVFASVSRIKEETKQLIAIIEENRRKIKEKYIKELMKPHKYFWFFTKQKTREEAEARLRILQRAFMSDYRDHFFINV